MRQVTVLAEFTDGTQYPALFSSADQYLPNLVTFAASPESSLTIDRDTGVATLSVHD